MYHFVEQPFILNIFGNIVSILTAYNLGTLFKKYKFEYDILFCEYFIYHIST